jgi:hypothetical protein
VGESLQQGMRASDMTYEELWVRQVALGGDASPLEVEAYVLGLLRASSFMHDVIAQALNEHYMERGGDHPVAYARDRAED